MNGKITTFYLRGGKDFEKWVYQNKAEYSGNYVEGCLLDNFIMVTKRGFAAFYEVPCTTWTSKYRVEFQKGAAQDVWRKWYEFEDAAEREAEKQEREYTEYAAS